jgi:molybdopterin converting factor small subunit
MVTVRIFARYRELLGVAAMEMPLPSPPTLAVLLADPRFQSLPPEALIAVNQRFAERSVTLKEGDEVALMPPVSGG